MHRHIEQSLTSWRNQPERSPLLLRGARQTGKTFVVEKWGQANFKSLVSVNFELQPELKTCFDNLHPIEIIKSLGILINQEIIPGDTLLFLDEIQDCPNAIRSLRYFKEKMPDLHVIGAGSLLEFVLNDASFRMPVGRIQFMYLKPLSFQEFLVASEHDKLASYLNTVTLQDHIPDAIHQQLLKLLKEYWITGGMPAAVANFLKYKSAVQLQQIQTSLLDTYRRDFGKYAVHAQHKYLQKFFNKTPQLIAQDFKYSHIDTDIRSRELKVALEKLGDAGLIQPSYATNASGLPLAAHINDKKMKLFFLDIGLVLRALQITANVFFEEDLLLINQGALAEQFVAQELLANHNPLEEAQLFFWVREKRNSLASIDFISTVDQHIIPIEVKAGTTGRMKSLQVFMEEKKSALGVRISQSPLSYANNILSIPLYMIAEMPRLVAASIKR